MASGGIGVGYGSTRGSRGSHIQGHGSQSGTGTGYKINQVCRYFLHGACNKGDSCRFSHDKSKSVPADNICRYYLAGTCVYGDKCRYDHVKSRFETELKGPKDREMKLSDKPPSHMVSLTKGGFDKSLALANQEKKKEDSQKKWAEAKEFVPGQRYQSTHIPGSYSQAVEPEAYGAVGGFDYNIPSAPQREIKEDDLLCPYFAHDCYCPYGEECKYAHGDICDMCGLPKLHPKNKDQREAHLKECLDGHTRDMELAFLVKESEDKECGICLEVIKDKTADVGTPVDRRFGILENCNHCFCLPCIKEWRQKRCAEKNTHRSCPVCRTHSNFVTPSEFWVEEEDKKKQLIATYKTEIGKKPCQYFKQGKGECPFYDKCFYLHALPDGSIAPPQPRPKRRRLVDDGGEDSFMEAYSLWDFFATRDVDESMLSDLLTLEDELSLILLDALHSDDEEDYYRSSDSD